MNLNLPNIIGHRGIKGLAPENTLPSLQLAIKHKIKWIEVDVKVSKDNIPFLLHDDLLDRTTSGKGLPYKYTYKEIKDLDAGSWFNTNYRFTYPPNLEEVINFCIKHKLGINIELKPNKGKEIDNVNSICALFDKIKFNIKYYFSSFDYNSLQLLRNKMPKAFLGYLIDSLEKKGSVNAAIHNCLKLNCFSIGFNIKIINTKILNLCKENNLQVTVYSKYNIDYNTALELWAFGVKSSKATWK